MVKNDLTGQTFGKLTVVCLSDRRAPRGKRTTPVWECRCECGAAVYQATDSLHRAGVRMCERCRELYAAEKARAGAGYVEGTQISRLKDMSPTAASTSGVRGVVFDRTSGKWRARLRFRGKLMNFGSYSSIEEAAAARAKAEKEYFLPVLLAQEGAE